METVTELPDWGVPPSRTYWVKAIPELGEGSDVLPVNFTGEVYQPAFPGVPLVRAIDTDGATLSRLIEAFDIRDVSPLDESAQKLSEVDPSGKFQTQLRVAEPPVHRFPNRSDSMAVMVHPETGSFPVRLRVAPPRHQPELPGLAQAVEPFTVAGGRFVVVVWLVHPASPEEQPTVELPVRLMLHVMPLPQVPGQPVPQAVGALLKYPATLPVESQLPVV